MRHIAAHYVFDGKTFHKYSLITLNESNCFVSLMPMEPQETAGVEFYSGILIPLSLSDKNNENPENVLKQRLCVTSLQGIAVSSLSPFVTPFFQGEKSSILLLENLDLVALTLAENTKIRWLV